VTPIPAWLLASGLSQQARALGQKAGLVLFPWFSFPFQILLIGKILENSINLPKFVENHRSIRKI
jgi:hypothetical protein